MVLRCSKHYSVQEAASCSFCVCGGDAFVCMHGGQEHRDLAQSQFEHLQDPDCYVYCGNASKNKQTDLSTLPLDELCFCKMSCVLQNGNSFA